MNRVLSSLALTPSLFFVALTCFFWGTNAHKYPPDSLVASVLALFAAAAVASGIGFMLRIFWNKSALDKHRLARLLLGGVIGGVCICLINIVFRDVVRLILPTDFGRLCFRIILLCSMTALFFFHAKNVIRFLNIAFLASICISFYSMAAVFWEDYFYESENTADTVMSVTLEKTPNIYLFWMESFHEPRIIDKYYGTTLVQDGVLEEFEKRGFRFFENTYSNSRGTVLSMTDLFSMRLGLNREAGLLDAKPFVQRLLGGNEDNRLLKILKENGYFTAFISRANVNFHNGNIGKYLDSTDFAHNNSLPYYFQPLLALNPRQMARFLGFSREDVYRDMSNGYPESLQLLDRVHHAMQLAKNAGKPLFVSFKGGATHIDGSSYTWRQQSEWLSFYREFVKKVIPQTLEILDMIVANDPGAVIILMGDHGPFRLYRIYDDVDMSDTKAFAAYLRQNNESLQSFVDDFYNIVFAVRMPGYEGDFSQGRAISTVNVFRHVFAALNDDPSILEDSQPNVSTLFGTQLVVDGEVISE